MMKLISPLAAACLVLAIGCGSSSNPTAQNTTGTTTATTGAGGPADTTGLAATSGTTSATPPKIGISKLKALSIHDVKIGDGVIQGIKVGNQKPVQAGDMVSLEYTGKLQDGTMFDTNVPGVKIGEGPNNHAKPLVFVVGRGGVVKGMDQGVVGMKIGGERKIGIPPALGYGNQVIGDPAKPIIPPGSDLLFEVKLLDIVKPGEEGIFDYKDLSVGSGRAIKTGDTVQIEYTVKLADGKVVDTNVGKNRPYEFTIGEMPARVIAGMEKGVVGMKKGGSRLLRVPPAIGYGTKKIPDNAIPPNSTLIIQVKVLEVM